MSKKVISLILVIFLLLAFLSTTVNAAASAKVFASSKSGYYNDSAVYAKYGLEDLGYSVSTSIGAITKSAMLSWIGNTGNGYGFYVHTFGGDGYFNDYNGYSIDADDISGNWDLVYIDSAYSAKTNELARAFHTVGYSDRCFLGWYKAVTTSNANAFNYYFWTEYVTHATIRSAALAAAASVPGDGTTPVRFYGDTSYDGSAR